MTKAVLHVLSSMSVSGSRNGSGSGTMASICEGKPLNVPKDVLFPVVAPPAAPPTHNALLSQSSPLSQRFVYSPNKLHHITCSSVPEPSPLRNPFPPVSPYHFPWPHTVTQLRSSIFLLLSHTYCSTLGPMLTDSVVLCSLQGL